MELAGGELMEKEKVQAWNGASRRGTNGRGEGTNVNGDGRRKTNGRRGREGDMQEGN
jgi:hypothetical protein